MRLFAYYSLHTMGNRLKKFLRSWKSIVMLLCIAALAGAVLLYVWNHQSQGTSAAMVVEQVKASAERVGESPDNLAVLCFGITAVFCFAAAVFFSEWRGGMAFRGADIRLLFPSPMRPQSILLFRLPGQLAAYLIHFAVIAFAVIAMTNTLNHGAVKVLLSAAAAFAVILLTAALLQIVFYLLTASGMAAGPKVRWTVFGIFLLIVAGVGITWAVTDGSLIHAATGFFSSDLWHWIPLAGWVTGFLSALLDGETGRALCFLALTLVCDAGLICCIRYTNADFYEDVIAFQGSYQVASVRERKEQ